MWTYHPELLETPVPRYTSYPTAADFGELPDNAHLAALQQARGDISLYLHIPFCEQICYYCGCNTEAAGKRERVRNYLAALHAEIETVASHLPADARVRRIAFGGGSPNAILPPEFLELVEALNRHFHLADAEYSIELDPRSLTREWSDVIAATGITRASMGVQTFAPDCQKAIGRVQSDTLIWQGTEWLRNAGVHSLNFDLMYGLPHQSLADLEHSLEQASALGADRIALFGYAHVPHIVKRQKVIDAASLPEGKMRFDMARFGHQYLCAQDYQPIGFDHFALADDPLAIAARTGGLRRNFQGFTDDPSQVLIGMGASAISSFPSLLAQNEKNSGRYRMLTTQSQLAANNGIIRSDKDRMNGRTIEALLCQGAAELSPCQYARARANLAPFEARGLIAIDGLYLAILPDGLPYARVIAALFDDFRKFSARRFSSAI